MPCHRVTVTIVTEPTKSTARGVRTSPRAPIAATPTPWRPLCDLGSASAPRATTCSVSPPSPATRSPGTTSTATSTRSPGRCGRCRPRPTTSPAHDRGPQAAASGGSDGVERPRSRPRPPRSSATRPPSRRWPSPCAAAAGEIDRAVADLDLAAITSGTTAAGPDRRAGRVGPHRGDVAVRGCAQRTRASLPTRSACPLGLSTGRGRTDSSSTGRRSAEQPGSRGSRTPSRRTTGPRHCAGCSPCSTRSSSTSTRPAADCAPSSRESAQPSATVSLAR